MLIKAASGNRHVTNCKISLHIFEPRLILEMKSHVAQDRLIAAFTVVKLKGN